MHIPTRKSWAGVCLAVTAALLSGCSSVPVWEQQTLARAQMQFTDRMAESNDFGVWATVEPGTANSTGAASACSACR